MTKTKLIAMVVASALALGGCVTIGGSEVKFTPPTVQEVQAASVSACAFLPTAGTVAAIIASLSGRDTVVTGVTTAQTVASAICAALVNATTTPTTVVAAKRGGPAPVTVNGIIVRGQYTL